MKFGEAILSGFNKYYEFKGRSSRSEYWYLNLFMLLATFVAMGVDTLIFGVDRCAYNDPGCALRHHVAENILNLVFMLPTLAVSVRRMHDVDRSGWWLLSILPPIYWIFIKGTTGPNRFGADPLAGKA